MLSKNAIIQGDSAVQLTAAKKKTMKMEAAKKTAKKSTKKIKHRMRRSKHKGCGTFMYRSKKTGKCVDARA